MFLKRIVLALTVLRAITLGGSLAIAADSPAASSTAASLTAASLTSGSAPYLDRDFCAAVVVHPQRMAASSLGKSLSLDEVLRRGLKEAGFPANRLQRVPRAADIVRVTVVVEPFPGGNVMFMPAAVIEFAENQDLMALCRVLWPDGIRSSDDARIYRTGMTLANDPIHVAVVDRRTALFGPESTLAKMLSKNSASGNHLLQQLRRVKTSSDIHLEYHSAPALAAFAKLIGQPLNTRLRDTLHDDPELDEWTKAILLDLEALSLNLDLSGDRFLQARIECHGLEEAGRMEGLLQQGIRQLGGLAASVTQDAPPAIAGPLRSFMRDISLRAKLTRTADRLVLEVPATESPRELILQVAKEAGIPIRQPFAELAGTWVIQYSNKAKRTYTIAADGTVKYADATFQLTESQHGVLLTHPTKTRELLRLAGGKLRVRRYHHPSVQQGVSRFPDKPTVTGVGERE